MNSFLFYSLAFFLLFICLLMVLLVFLQNPKDEGESDVFGTGAIKHVVGTAQAAPFLKKITYFFIFGYFSVGFAINIVSHSSNKFNKEVVA